MDVAENSQREFIVPAKTVNELNRLLLDKGVAEIRYAENQAAFTLNQRAVPIGGNVDAAELRAYRRRAPSSRRHKELGEQKGAGSDQNE